ncbi:MAG: DUF4286 family protein [Holophagaceae bacterium]|nr:DUF4286 family protein [Holophagaceae bacterium]
MTAYEVAVDVEAGLADAFLRYMLDRHIPEILATGCFQAIRFERASETRFRTRYEAASRPDLERYLEDHASALRADFAAHFPAGCAAVREVWSEVRVFLPER